MREAVVRNTEGFPVHKEYPEGYKWIELKMPEPKLAEGYSIVRDTPTPSNWSIVPHPEGKGYALRAENGQMAMDARGRLERKWDTPEEAQKSINCNVHLYVITAEMIGVFSIAEAVNSSLEKGKITIFHVIPDGFSKPQIKSLEATCNLISRNGGISYIDNELMRTARVINFCFK